MFDLLGMWLGKTNTLETFDSMSQQAANDEVNYFSCILCFCGIYVLANGWFYTGLLCAKQAEKKTVFGEKHSASLFEQ